MDTKVRYPANKTRPISGDGEEPVWWTSVQAARARLRVSQLGITYSRGVLRTKPVDACGWLLSEAWKFSVFFLVQWVVPRKIMCF